MPPPAEVQHVTPTQGDRPDALDGTDNQFFRGPAKKVPNPLNLASRRRDYPFMRPGHPKACTQPSRSNEP